MVASIIVYFVCLIILSQSPTTSAADCEPACSSGQRCILNACVNKTVCPTWQKFGPGPDNCTDPPTDPNNLSAAPMERWFTEEMFNDLFPKANIGWGPNDCSPYSYKAFVIAARYFPKFGADSLPDNGYTAEENQRRDLANFFAHAVQETGENDASIYDRIKNVSKADDCFYRGGFFNWFEGGPISIFLNQSSPGYKPEDGDECIPAGRYCAETPDLQYFFPCRNESSAKDQFKGCYFGRGAIQISYNYNYGMFQNWLHEHNIFLNILDEPNLLMTHRHPPLAILASMWFYMTPQPPKPSMHDLVLGAWEPGKVNRAAGYKGPAFGVTSLVINNECNGEDASTPGGPGESRRIKAFKWFCKYFNASVGPDKLLTCKHMPQRLDQIKQSVSWQPDWANTWKEAPCNCSPASYGGEIPYFQADYYPKEFVDQNEKNRQRCVESVYDNPGIYNMTPETSACLKHSLTNSTAAPSTSTSTTNSAKTSMTLKPKQTSTTRVTETVTEIIFERDPLDPDL